MRWAPGSALDMNAGRARIGLRAVGLRAVIWTCMRWAPGFDMDMHELGAALLSVCVLETAFTWLHTSGEVHSHACNTMYIKNGGNAL